MGNYFIIFSLIFIHLPWEISSSTDIITISDGDKQLQDNSNNFKPLIIDIDYILQNAKEARQIKMHMDKLKGQVQKDIMHLETKLRKQYANLHSMSKKHQEYDNRKDNFMQQGIKVQKFVQEKRNSLEEVYFEALEKFKSKVNKILLDFVQEGGYTLVIRRQAIVYCQKDIDKTQVLLKLVNNSYEPVKIELK